MTGKTQRIRPQGSQVEHPKIDSLADIFERICSEALAWSGTESRSPAFRLPMLSIRQRCFPSNTSKRLHRIALQLSSKNLLLTRIPLFPISWLIHAAQHLHAHSMDKCCPFQLLSEGVSLISSNLMLPAFPLLNYTVKVTGYIILML